MEAWPRLDRIMFRSTLNQVRSRHVTDRVGNQCLGEQRGTRLRDVRHAAGSDVACPEAATRSTNLRRLAARKLSQSKLFSTMSESATHDAIEAVARDSYGRLVAYIASRTGDIAAPQCEGVLLMAGTSLRQSVVP